MTEYIVPNDPVFTVHILMSDDLQEPFTAKIEELPGCMSHGDTFAKTLVNLGEAVESFLQEPDEIDPCECEKSLTFYILNEEEVRNIVGDDTAVDEVLETLTRWRPIPNGEEAVD